MIKTCVIIGLGKIGMGYDYNLNSGSVIHTHARAIKEHPKFKLIGGVDKSKNQKILFEKLYGVPTFDNTGLALEMLQPDVIIISTPTETHSSILEKVIKVSRPKIILCEKPLAYDLDQAKHMVNICSNLGIHLFVNYMRSVDIGALEIKRRIEIGEIITPVKANVFYSKGIFNNGSHFLQLLSLWLGDLVSTKIIKPGHLWNNLDPEPDFDVKFNLGTATFRTALDQSFSPYSIELSSPSGSLFYNNGGKNIEFQAAPILSNFTENKTIQKNKENISNSMDIYQWHVYDNIYKYLSGYKTTLCTGLKALEILRGIDLIIKQREKN